MLVSLLDLRATQRRPFIEPSETQAEVSQHSPKQVDFSMPVSQPADLAAPCFKVEITHLKAEQRN